MMQMLASEKRPGQTAGALVSIVAVDSWLSGQRQNTVQDLCHEAEPLRHAQGRPLT